ncbi:MAG: anti-sigma factor family protein, partial [Planctomycetota bacterium]
MSQIENPNIEELLNSYIDGELTEREQTEVKRLISHDAQVAQRLRELQTSKILVSSLPRAEAPDRILDGVKASLETEALSSERAWSEEPSVRRVGVRHLMVRK